MTIIEKYFDKKPTDKELYNFIDELMLSNKGGYKTELIYDKKNFPNYMQFRIFDDKIS